MRSAEVSGDYHHIQKILLHVEIHALVHFAVAIRHALNGNEILQPRYMILVIQSTRYRICSTRYDIGHPLRRFESAERA